MNKLLALALSGLLVAAASAQTTTDRHGVTTDTDPARAAAVEKQAQALRAEHAKTAKPHQRHAVKHHHHAKAHRGAHAKKPTA